MGGLWLLLKAIDEQNKWKLFSAGLLFGLAFLMKQPGAAFGLFGVLYLLRAEGWRAGRWRNTLRRLACLGVGEVLPFAVTCLILWRAGVFPKFWFWTFSYAYQYGTNVSAATGWHYFVKNSSKAFSSAIGLWILAAAGVSSFLWSRKAQTRADFLLGLLFFSGLAVSAGLYFRRHYFIMLLPAVSLLAGLAVDAASDLTHRAKRRAWQYLPTVAFLIVFSSSLLQESYFFFQADPTSASRYVYPDDPFAESLAVARYIEQYSSPSASIAVFGSEPQILFYSRRRSATGYLYGYSLTEEQKYASTMQQQAISEIEAAHPEYIVSVRDWDIRPQSEKAIFAWAKTYFAANYDLIGVMRVRDGLQLRSEDEIRTTPGTLWAALFLFRRKTP
jgi:hypothetical protein